MDQLTTWDGEPVSREPPYGAAILIFRRKQERVEFLLLHRAANGVDYEGEWAWTPPSGARIPAESIDSCAVRELREETGLELPLQLTDFGNPEWWVYCAEAGMDETVVLDAEHDRFVWLSPSEAMNVCKPDEVNRPLKKLARTLRRLNLTTRSQPTTENGQ